MIHQDTSSNQQNTSQGNTTIYQAPVSSYYYSGGYTAPQGGGSGSGSGNGNSGGNQSPAPSDSVDEGNSNGDSGDSGNAGDNVPEQPDAAEE